MLIKEIGDKLAHIEEALAHLLVRVRRFEHNLDEYLAALETGTVCPICVERIVDDTYLRLGCHHIFHLECISRWLGCKTECPVCRRTCYELT
jgi:hypothetical protein